MTSSSSSARSRIREAMTNHPALASGRVAVITGAATGIRQSAGLLFRSSEMKVSLADTDERELEAAARELSRQGGAGEVLSVATDVSQLADLERLRDLAWPRLGPVS